MPFPVSYDTAQRVRDVTVVLLLSVCALPLAVLIAAAIWLDDGAPIFFRQTRSGLRGQPFNILKFRTLSLGSHDPSRPQAAATRVGLVLRRWGLDELPQLWNVLRGEMSLVGPRPTLPQQVARYGAHERERLQVRPGLTGWAQVHGRNALDWPERIERDVWYVEHRSLWLDACILWRTPGVLLSGNGTYGSSGRNPGYDPSRDAYLLP